MKMISQEKMQGVLDWSYNQAVNGAPGLPSATDLAESYLSKHSDTEKAIEQLVKWQVSKCATSGFLSGLGGVITMPVAVPANISSVLYVQIRMIAAIAHMRGYNLKDDQVQTMVYVSLTGQSIAELGKSVGVQFAMKAGKAQVNRIPGKVLVKINQAVGFRLLTKFGSKGVINLGKAVPFIGGAVGGGFDAVSTKAIAKNAKNNLPNYASGKGKNIIFDM
ncbi:EcsC family protein [Salinicoccus roseus]|uniref:EcsC family protein n=1 Tax=Salinicoccus roseus TaxID=45670 RepID=UPI0023019F13|nr:EcsC family protein [Salinicoccus roseus]